MTFGVGRAGRTAPITVDQRASTRWKPRKNLLPGAATAPDPMLLPLERSQRLGFCRRHVVVGPCDLHQELHQLGGKVVWRGFHHARLAFFWFSPRRPECPATLAIEPRVLRGLFCSHLGCPKVPRPS